MPKPTPMPIADRPSPACATRRRSSKELNVPSHGGKPVPPVSLGIAQGDFRKGFTLVAEGTVSSGKNPQILHYFDLNPFKLGISIGIVSRQSSSLRKAFVAVSGFA